MKQHNRLPIVLVDRGYTMERQIVSALKSIIINDLRQAYLHLDIVEFKDVLTEVKEVIQSYADVELANVLPHADNRHEK